MASKITAATAGIATTTFPETPSIDDTIIGNDNRDTGVRLVDVKQDGGTSPRPHLRRGTPLMEHRRRALA